MLDAVRIRGRWVSRHLLERLTNRTLGDASATRAQLVELFCRGTHWKDPKGRYARSSARVALKRLEERGLVRLPPPSGRAAPRRRRQLWDDGKALPPLPDLPGSVEKIPGLRLRKIEGAEDPLHGLWNRLIGREHPLKRAPLVGAQLRYLIECGEPGREGYLGAFGFGPAAYHLECRDSWIGWSEAARAANRTRLIGLSRFLIRPGIRCANLASRCYRLVLERIGRDWEAAFGVRPLLVETYVDRSTQTGISLAAANWRRLGQSLGRGRSSPSPRERPESIKDVWVCELSRRARERLQDCPPEEVAPRSVFLGVANPGAWSEQELDGLELGSLRLERRFKAMLAARWKKRGQSFGSSFAGAEAKAAYRFLSNRQAGIGFESLLAPHHRQTHRRMAAEKVVVLAQDTTTLSYNTLEQTRGLGPIADIRKPGRGLFLHSLQAFRIDGIPLGCAWARLWARSTESDTAQRNEQSIAQKESQRWLAAYQSASQLARAMPRSLLVVCADRESDIFELFDQSESAPANLRLLVRAQHDRALENGRKLWESLEALSVGALMEVEVPRRLHRPARRATLGLRWSAIDVSAPRVALKKSWQPLGLHAVMAREIDPPADTEPIEWVLLSDVKVDSAKLARRLVRGYGLRWGIECWHQTLKSDCGVENRQMKSAVALERALALDMMIAWRARLLCRLAKEQPNLPASLHYAPEELAVLEAYRPQLPRWAGGSPQTSSCTSTSAAPALPQPSPHPTGAPAPAIAENPRSSSSGPPALTLLQANVLVAMLAGYHARKGDGPPGPILVGRGLALLVEVVRYTRLVSKATPHDSSALRDPTHKPG